MSFMEKIGSIMQRPGEDVVPKDEVSRWMKYSGRACGAVGGGIAIFLGLWNCVSILVANVPCLVSGLWQMVAGFVVIMIEAPCCCLFIDFVQTFSDKFEKRPYWNRAAFYVAIALPPVILCPGMSSIIGSGLIFATGVIYGMMALGKKATPEEMRANAAQVVGPPPTKQSQKSNLVDNAAPMGFSGTIPPV